MTVRELMSMCSDPALLDVRIYEGPEALVYEGDGDEIPEGLLEKTLFSWDVGRYGFVINL